MLILQWNARSLIANGQEFKEDIDKLDSIMHSGNMALDFIIKGHTFICKYRNGNGGGGAIFIKEGINYSVRSPW